MLNYFNYGIVYTCIPTDSCTHTYSNRLVYTRIPPDSCTHTFSNILRRTPSQCNMKLLNIWKLLQREKKCTKCSIYQIPANWKCLTPNWLILKIWPSFLVALLVAFVLYYCIWSHFVQQKNTIINHYTSAYSTLRLKNSTYTPSVEIFLTDTHKI